MLDGNSNQEEEQMIKRIGDKAILSQIASLLVKESLLDPNEQLRFLTLLKEED